MKFDWLRALTSDSEDDHHLMIWLDSLESELKDTTEGKFVKLILFCQQAALKQTKDALRFVWMFVMDVELQVWIFRFYSVFVAAVESERFLANLPDMFL